MPDACQAFRGEPCANFTSPSTPLLTSKPILKTMDHKQLPALEGIGNTLVPCHIMQVCSRVTYHTAFSSSALSYGCSNKHPATP